MHATPWARRSLHRMAPPLVGIPIGQLTLRLPSGSALMQNRTPARPQRPRSAHGHDARHTHPGTRPTAPPRDETETEPDIANDIAVTVLPSSLQHFGQLRIVLHGKSHMSVEVRVWPGGRHMSVEVRRNRRTAPTGGQALCCHPLLPPLAHGVYGVAIREPRYDAAPVISGLAPHCRRASLTGATHRAPQQ